MVRRAWVLDSAGLATIQFSKRDAVTAIWNDVKAGIIQNLSPGMWIYNKVDTTPKGELRKQYKVDLRIVQYKGEAPMWTDVASGVIDAAFGSFNAARVVVDSGRARAIAVSRKRLPAQNGELF